MRSFMSTGRLLLSAPSAMLESARIDQRSGGRGYRQRRADEARAPPSGAVLLAAFSRAAKYPAT